MELLKRNQAGQSQGMQSVDSANSRPKGESMAAGWRQVTQRMKTELFKPINGLKLSGKKQVVPETVDWKARLLGKGLIKDDKQAPALSPQEPKKIDIFSPNIQLRIQDALQPTVQSSAEQPADDPPRSSLKPPSVSKQGPSLVSVLHRGTSKNSLIISDKSNPVIKKPLSKMNTGWKTNTRKPIALPTRNSSSLDKAVPKTKAPQTQLDEYYGVDRLSSGSRYVANSIQLNLGSESNSTSRKSSVDPKNFKPGLTQSEYGSSTNSQKALQKPKGSLGDSNNKFDIRNIKGIGVGISTTPTSSDGGLLKHAQPFSHTKTIGVYHKFDLKRRTVEVAKEKSDFKDCLLKRVPLVAEDCDDLNYNLITKRSVELAQPKSNTALSNGLLVAKSLFKNGFSSSRTKLPEFKRRTDHPTTSSSNKPHHQLANNSDSTQKKELGQEPTELYEKELDEIDMLIFNSKLAKPVSKQS